ncbi:CG30467, partial [Drosophila busckii]
DETDGELLERMRADAVGETMYSKKYILQTLMKLSQQPAETGLGLELEDDLCKVWDMSVAPEVVSLLLENDAIELIMFAISSSDDVRLYEILIGLLGNMCAKLQCVEQLTAHPEWVEMLLKLTTCMDTCMLLQLMRVYQYVMAHVVSGKEQLGIDWYICFAAFDGSARNLGFILQQSVSDELLLAALKAINSVLASCALVEEENARTDLKLRPFADVFLVPELCDGVNNAFIRLMRDDLAKQADEIDAETGAQITADTELDDDDCGEDLNVPKISCDVEVIQTYLNICTILVQLPEAQTSMNLYVSSIMFCLTRILQFLQQPMQLIPMGERQEEYLEDLAHICSCLKYYYNSATFINLLAVWVSLKLHINNYVDLDEHDFEAFDDEPLSQYEENAFKVLRLLAHMLIKADAAVILSDIKGIDALQVNMFRAALQAEQEEDVVLQKALERLHVVFNELNGQA